MVLIKAIFFVSAHKRRSRSLRPHAFCPVVTENGLYSIVKKAFKTPPKDNGKRNNSGREDNELVEEEDKLHVFQTQNITSTLAHNAFTDYVKGLSPYALDMELRMLQIIDDDDEPHTRNRSKMGWVPTLLGYSAQVACKFGFYEFFKKYYSGLAGP